MAQADSITTATREGVSRGVSIKSTSLRPAHTDWTAPIAGNPIQLIYLDFESKDLDSRRDRLDKAFAALHLYVAAFVSDTAQHIPGCSVDGKDVNKLFMDVRSDEVTVIRNAPEELRDHENRKVS
jgi:hypothetical protein